MLEPCVLGICFPYLSLAPWTLRGTLSKMWKTDEVVRKSVLHELSWSVGRFPRCIATYCDNCCTSSDEMKFFKMEVPRSLHPVMLSQVPNEMSLKLRVLVTTCGLLSSVIHVFSVSA